MLQSLNLRKVFKTVMFLMACVLITGCYTLTTVTTSTIPAKTEALIVHADESHWTVVDYSFTDSFLTAQVSPDTVKFKKGKTVHIYAAPVSAVTVEGTTLTVPLDNIGKTDYFALNFWETFGLLGGGAYLLFSMIAGSIQ
jgi:hypothetical protein